jgi:aryl-phospho-beta-D-glucosidase BglC (GH1 family)
MRKFKGYMHGINLGGWFSQCDHSEKRYDQFIKREDLSRIRSLGFDHVRIPVDYELVLNKDLSYKADGLNRIARCIEWSKENGLNMILDLHKTPGFSFDDAEDEHGFFESGKYQQIFYDLWSLFARNFGSYEHLSFELLNEVSEKKYSDTWNRIIHQTIKRIREDAPDMKILVGGYHNNSIEAIKDLDPPYDDKIIYNFHCYLPLVFTHQGAYWVKGMDRDFRMGFDKTYKEYAYLSSRQISKEYKESFPDEDRMIGEDYFLQLFDQAVRIAEERNVPLYCGEYGVIDLADPEETLKWFRCIHAAFERYQIGRSLWSYKEMDFGLVDAHYDKIRKELLELI